MLIYILVKYFDVVLQTFSALGKNDMLGSDMTYILKSEAQLRLLDPADIFMSDLTRTQWVHVSITFKTCDATIPCFLCSTLLAE